MPAASPVFPDTPENHRLWVALARDNGPAAVQALADGASPSAVFVRKHEQEPALTRTVRRERPAVMEALLAHGADPGLPVVSPVRLYRTDPPAVSRRLPPPFVLQAQKGPLARTREWLERFPSCRTPALLAEALYALKPGHTEAFELLMATARTLPPAQWEEVVSAELLQWVAHRPLDRIRSFLSLAPPLSPDARSRALYASIPNGAHAVAHWFLEEGADPLHPIATATGEDTARNRAMAYNRPQLLAHIDRLLAASGRVFDRAAWRAEIIAAVKNGTRAVFKERWAAAPLSQKEKEEVLGRVALASKCFPASYGPLPLVEWAMVPGNIHRDHRVAWVREIIATGTTTRESRTRAAHRLCEDVLLNQTTKDLDVRLMTALAKAGLDWTWPAPSRNGSPPVSLDALRAEIPDLLNPALAAELATATAAVRAAPARRARL